jgi:hypothetical protein
MMMTKTPIYSDGSPMQLGDEIEFRGSLLVLFRRYRGRVAYVPGISPLNPDMETAALSWVAIDVPGKMLLRRLVDPETGRVRQTWLLRRDASEIKTLPPLAGESDN